MRIWRCPQCHGGVRGPDRPRRDSTVRYCLTCSAKTGRLVERSAPALERQQAERKAKRAARTSTVRERTKTDEVERRSAGDVDLLAEAKRFARLPALRDRIRRFPDITFRRAARKAFTSGHCMYGSPARITVTIGTDHAAAPETVLHEMVHAAVGHQGHSSLFWSLLRGAAKEAWPDARFDFVDVRNGWQTDVAICQGLRARAVNSQVTVP